MTPFLDAMSVFSSRYWGDLLPCHATDDPERSAKGQPLRVGNVTEHDESSNSRMLRAPSGCCLLAVVLRDKCLTRSRCEEPRGRQTRR